MLIQYKNYPLKKGCEYPFVNNGYSEIIYNGDDSVFNIVEESSIIKKTIDQILDAGYFDQYNKEAIKNLFKDKFCYFIYNEFEEKYCMMIFFNRNERETLSLEFQKVLVKKQCVIFNTILSDFEYISIESMEHKDNIKENDYIEDFWIYNLMFDEKILKDIK